MMPKRGKSTPQLEKDEFDDTDEDEEEDETGVIKNSGEEDDDDSDFEDPDSVEVPGGGKNLQTIANMKDGKSVQSSSFTVDDDLEVIGVVKKVPSVSSSRINYNYGANPLIPASLLAAQDPFYNFTNASTLLQKSLNGNYQQQQQYSHLLGLSNGGNSYGSQSSNYGQNLYGASYLGAQLSGGLHRLQNSQINHLWMNNGPSPFKTETTEEEEAAAEDEEDMGVIETYSNYKPPKLKIGISHPDPVVETASLASVEPPDVWYNLSLPEETIATGKLSALQLESITYTSQQHSKFLPDGHRAGFLIGDGAGVGKGRTIAGIIFENWCKGRKRSVWVSVSNDLKYDAERDLKDIGATEIDVHFLSKMKYAKINSVVNNNIRKGVMFATYSALIGESQNGGKYKTRLKQLLNWCGEDFEGCIVFDECHKAKNLCPSGAGKPTKTGLTVLDLQQKLPKARVVYASATGASEPKHMAYMVRLGIWGPGSPFKNFTEFLSAVEKRGVGAMEIVAMDMKLRGMYIARQLSFQGVSFKVDEIELSEELRQVYNKSVDLWVELLHKFNEAAELIDAEKKMKKTMWGQFWSSHQRFFKYLCIASKVNHVVKVAEEVIRMGKCVVIGLQSTGEARTLEAVDREEELTDFVSTAKGVLQSLVEKHFPAPDRDRINRLLGRPKSSSLLDELGIKTDVKKEEGGGDISSNGKRKRPSSTHENKVKKLKFEVDSTDEESEDKGSDYNVSDEDDNDDDDDDDEDDDDENVDEEDFNPFQDSDDDDPWAKRKNGNTSKKTKKKKEGKKGRKSKKIMGKSQNSKFLEPKTSSDSFTDLLHQKIKAEKVAAAAAATALAKNNGGGVGGDIKVVPPQDNVTRACRMKEEMLQKIEILGKCLPANTLDQLIDELGGPENVSEMTGRKGRVVQDQNGDVRYESRSEADAPLETLNITEKDRFMRGEKDVAIISEAASSGISLQADRRVKNRKRRVHMTLELPWSADRAIQQFGRTHRSNQVSAPEYILLISDLAGEHRFASIVAKRLESLGALTHGDRRATETRDLSRFNIDNKYGRAALEATFKAIMGYERPIVKPPSDYVGDFFKDIADGLVGVGLITQSEDSPGILTLDKGYNDMSKFLNRILGLKVHLQNLLFKYFSDTLDAIISQAKRSGRYDQGILDVGLTDEDTVELDKTHTFLRKHATGSAKIELHVLHVERGLSWDAAMEKWSELVGSEEGFWLSHQIRNNKKTAILACAVENNKTTKNKKEKMFIIYRPNTGQQVKHESLADLKKKYKKVSTDEAEPHWNSQFKASSKSCSHAYWRGKCKNMSMGLLCEIGLRRKTYNVLAGSVLTVWNQVETVLTQDGNRKGTSSKMQVVRLKLSSGKRIVGTLIPTSALNSILRALEVGSEQAEETIY